MTFSTKAARDRASSARVPLLGVYCLSLAACNLVCNMPEGTQRTGGEGGVGGTAEAGAPSSGGGGEVSLGGGGAGGGACPPEEHASDGTELLSNGSFEAGNTDWSSYPFDPVPGGFCGCSAASLITPDAFDDLRHLNVDPPPPESMIHAQVRLKAPDTLDAELLIFHDNLVVEPPIPFKLDAQDDEGADGWRLAKGTWAVGSTQWKTTYLSIAFSGPGDLEILVDCASYTYEPASL